TPTSRTRERRFGKDFRRSRVRLIRSLLTATHGRRSQLAARIAAQRLLPLAINRVGEHEPVRAPALPVFVHLPLALLDHLLLPVLVVGQSRDELLGEVAQAVAGIEQHLITSLDLLAARRLVRGGSLSTKQHSILDALDRDAKMLQRSYRRGPVLLQS